MSLRIKTLAIIAATLTVLAATVYISSSQIVLGRFKDLEREQAAENLQRARGAIETEVQRLNIAAGDWALWDDTYRFVQDQNSAYRDSNLSPDTALTLRTNMMLFFDANQNVVYALGVDLRTESGVTVSNGTLQSISATPGLLRFDGTSDSTSGLLQTAEGTLLLAARPIVQSDRSGPIMGSLVMARWLDDGLLAELASITQLELGTAPIDSLSADPNEIRAIDGDTLVAGTLVEDISGQPAFELQVEMPRDVYQEGQDTIRYLLYVLLGIGLGFGLLVTLLMEGIVVGPVRRLSGFVQSVGNSLSRRAPEMGRDEIGKLAISVNGMLDSIEASSRAVESANQQLLREHAEVELLNRSLEQKVEERTNDLRLANEELRERNRQLINARVLAATDGLTGLSNHRSFYERVGDLAGMERPVGVLMLDVDGFKQINDEHGHQVGDQILVRVAELLRGAVGDDHVYRYGGDEFAVLAEVDSLEDARLLGERLRNSIRERLADTGITVSVGVSVYPMIAVSPKEAVYQADAAMYLAKSAGKNAVRVWNPSVSPAKRRIPA